MTLTGYDSAYPQSPPPPSQVVLIYIGGDTPHVWTDAEIAGQPERYRLPVWVRSNRPVTIQDATDTIQWLQAHNVAPGVAVVLDLETLVDPGGVNVYGNEMHAHGYKVLPYGSRSTLYQNPALDGYFDAHPGDPLGTIDPGNVATQDVYANAYDLDTIAASVPLWDTQPAAPAPTTPQPDPPPTTREDEMLSDVVAFKAGQQDFFQVSSGNLYHKWSIDGGATWQSEQLPSYVKFAATRPQVQIVPGACYVRVEDDGPGFVYQYVQEANASSWTPTRLP